jgi:hypothetical protein
MAIGAIALVAAIPRLGPGRDVPADAPRPRRLWSVARRALITGTGEAGTILRSGDTAVIAGSIGYWAFDNAMLWTAFHAFGAAPPVMVILMGYLIGQLGGLLPLPGGVGGIAGGLLGTLVVYGVPAAAATAAVRLSRVVLFWLPLLGGAIAFASLRKALERPDRPDLCRDTPPPDPEPPPSAAPATGLDGAWESPPAGTTAKA